MNNAARTPFFLDLYHFFLLSRNFAADPILSAVKLEILLIIKRNFFNLWTINIKYIYDNGRLLIIYIIDDVVGVDGNGTVKIFYWKINFVACPQKSSVCGQGKYTVKHWVLHRWGWEGSFPNPWNLLLSSPGEISPGRLFSFVFHYMHRNVRRAPCWS